MTFEELKELQNQIIKKKKKIDIIFGIIWFIAFIIILSFFISLYKKTGFFLMIPMFIAVFMTSIIFFVIRHSAIIINLENDMLLFKYKFKNVFVLEALKGIFDNLRYNPGAGVSEDVVEKTRLVMLQDRFSSNDYISGTYKNVKFEQSDIHIEKVEEIEDDKGNIREKWTTTFLGKWMCFDFNKPFKSDVVIFNSNYFKFPGTYNGIKTEDVEFNKMFSVYSKSEHEAFYILTPHFMEKMKNLKKKLGGSTTFGFISNKLYIILDNNEDSFEYDVFVPIDENKIRERITGEIKIITDFVDELNLDNDLFKEV